MHVFYVYFIGVLILYGKTHVPFDKNWKGKDLISILPVKAIGFYHKK
jgi:hypothetical protein